MATIKAIEGRSVHQIQSGQVIVDLCSVVKELVENSLDAGATSIDVRFKNHGLESIEVQDNGVGISSDDYETIALKHFTSKLATYDDLSTLNTFGFRGEALSSLCALSKFHITTARDGEAPKGTRLEFDISGKLDSTTVAACQKGTTVTVEELFHNLPVRQRELEKNIKPPASDFLLLISRTKGSVSSGVKTEKVQLTLPSKKVVVFSTNSSQFTKDNIANIYGAKTLSAIVPLNLELVLQSSTSQAFKGQDTAPDLASRQVMIAGFISRPIFGEGRSTPDRQLFFVNSRPCGLPQIAKAFNEVYKSYNVTQSPFIFANLQMDTNAYDVNVSPDKRSILLHDQSDLLETLKASLIRLFDAQDQTVPQAELRTQKLPSFRPLFINRNDAMVLATESDGDNEKSPTRLESAKDVSSFSTGSSERSAHIASTYTSEERPTNLLQEFVGRKLHNRAKVNETAARKQTSSKLKDHLEEAMQNETFAASPSREKKGRDCEALPDFTRPVGRVIQDFNDRLASQQRKSAVSRDVLAAIEGETPTNIDASSAAAATRTSMSGPLYSAFDKMREKRTPVGSAPSAGKPKTSTLTIGSPPNKRRRLSDQSSLSGSPLVHKPQPAQSSRFSQKMRMFAAPGFQSRPSQAEEDTDGEGDADEEAQQGIDAGLDAKTSNLNGPLRLRAVSTDSSDDEYIDDDERRRRDEAQVAEMVRQAEEAAEQRDEGQAKRVTGLLKSRLRKDSTVSLIQILETSARRVEDQLSELTRAMQTFQTGMDVSEEPQVLSTPSTTSPEERLSLTISRSDFAEMRIIGQFNLGFILATRQSPTVAGPHDSSDELFIIDQHASDEIYNFSRLSLSTTLTPQPLVRPHPLELTAIEEETVLSHTSTLAKNGFNITVDESGRLPIGQRCQLLTLPTSRETIFDTRDLEELIALLAEADSSSAGEVVRPSKVRKMLAMRACRSSIMIGKHVSHRGMEAVVRHMGEIDKPWNCPHGRPTMRHLASLYQWGGWTEGDGLAEDEVAGMKTDWAGFVKDMQIAEQNGIQDAQTAVADVADDEEYSEDVDDDEEENEEDEEDRGEL